MHRLMPTGAVYDRQAAVSQCQARLNVDTRSVRPAMCHRIGHALDQGIVEKGMAARIE
jgi:hypothetical protein